MKTIAVVMKLLARPARTARTSADCATVRLSRTLPERRRLQRCEIFADVVRAMAFFAARGAVRGGGIERGDVPLQRPRYAAELPIGKTLQQLRVGVVGERVLAVRARLAGVEIGVRDIEPAARDGVERRREAGAGVLEAVGEQPLGFGRGRLEAERLQRSDLRDQPVEKGEEPRKPSRALVLRAEL